MTSEWTADRIRLLRLVRGEGQSSFARALAAASDGTLRCDQGRVSDWERGRWRPSKPYVKALRRLAAMTIERREG